MPFFLLKEPLAGNSGSKMVPPTKLAGQSHLADEARRIASLGNKLTLDIYRNARTQAP